MNRNLANSMSALAATAAVLVVALMVAVPARSTTDSAGQILATAVAPNPVADLSTQESGPARATGGGAGQLTRTLAMPYFSFVPRG